jgi:hypothetical protein
VKRTCGVGALVVSLVSSSAALAAEAKPSDAPTVAQAVPVPAAPAANAAVSERVEHARGLFREARALVGKGDYEAACGKFEQSLALDSGIGTKFNLADCWEHLGKVTGARTMFEDVAERAHESGQFDREKAARVRAAALDAQVPHLTISVSTPGVEIKRDGIIVVPSDWGTAVAVDPGLYEIRAVAEGKKPWSSRVEIPASSETITVVVPKLEDDVLAKADPKGDSKGVPPASLAETPPEPKSSPLSTDRIVLFGAVGAGALFAGGSLLYYKIRNDQARNVCPSSIGCSNAQVQQHGNYVDDAKAARSLSYIGFGVAGAALIAATVVSFEIGHTHDSAGAARISAGPTVAGDGAGATVQGRF